MTNDEMAGKVAWELLDGAEQEAKYAAITLKALYWGLTKMFPDRSAEQLSEIWVGLTEWLVARGLDPQYVEKGVLLGQEVDTITAAFFGSEQAS